MNATEKRLREYIKDLERDNRELNEDRRLFRQHFTARFRWWIQLVGEGKTPNTAELIESDAKWLRNFKEWMW
ncbi:MAG: hypothetical protein HC794_01835 [Nitrospiraceae bacterium]|nr:hypothetical protein [Nitrospiraceae bacterium]